MTDTKCESRGYSILPVSGDGAKTFTCCPNSHVKSVTDFEHEDVAIVEVEFVTNTIAI